MQPRFRLQDLALPLTLGVVVNVVVDVVYDVGWQVQVAIALSAVLLAAILSWRSARRRFATVQALQEVSSARCGDHFLRLADLAFRELGSPEEAMAELRALAAIRKYPNRRFMDDLLELAAEPGGRGLTPGLARGYLDLVPNARRLAHAQVIERLSQYVHDLPPETHIVLYGYSSTVCEGLARCGSWLSAHVFLVEDLQYGVEGSLGEHVYARRRLEESGITPILIPFSQIASLVSTSATFVSDVAGRDVPLQSNRLSVALLGCEAVDVDGQILIPSRIRGAPSETAKFVEVFQHAARAETQRLDVARAPTGQTHVVVASESYKAYDDLSGAAALSHAPLKASAIRRMLYVAGLRSLPKPLEVELVRLRLSSVHALIDDAGVHVGGEGREMITSLRLWRARTTAQIHEAPAPAGLGPLLKRARVAIFDLNGVLMDDETVHFVAFREMLRSHGAGLQYEEYRALCSGRTDREGVERLIAAKGLEGDPSELAAQKQECYARHAGDMADLAFPGAIEVARALDTSGAECFLVTSSDEDRVTEFVSACGLEEVFPAKRLYAGVSSAERADVFRRAAALAGHGPEACLVVDDNPSNLFAARKLGMSTVGVATTYPADYLGADVVVNGPLALPQLTEHGDG